MSDISIAGTFATNGTTFPIAYATQVQGCSFPVADNTARDAIDASIRVAGMEVYSIGAATTYRLVGGIANGNWTAVTAGYSTMAALYNASASAADVTLDLTSTNWPLRIRYDNSSTNAFGLVMTARVSTNSFQGPYDSPTLLLEASRYNGKAGNQNDGIGLRVKSITQVATLYVSKHANESISGTDLMRLYDSASTTVELESLVGNFNFTATTSSFTGAVTAATSVSAPFYIFSSTTVPALSASSTGRLAYNQTHGMLQVSMNGGLYVDIMREGGPFAPRRLANGSASVTLTDTDHYVPLTNTSARTVTLPAASAVPGGLEYIVKDIAFNAGTNNITINRAGSDTIDGATSYVISANGGAVAIRSDGSSKWEIIHTYGASSGGSVTSVSAGTGMSFTTITSTGSVAIDTTVVATTSNTLSMSNKTLTSPVLSSSVTGTYTLAGTPTLGASLAVGTTASYAIGDTTHVLTSVATAKLIGGSTNTSGHTVPNVADDTVALLAATQTLSAKTLTAPVINGVTSSGSTSIDWSGNSGTFKTATGANTFGGSSNTFSNGATVTTGSWTLTAGDFVGRHLVGNSSTPTGSVGAAAAGTGGTPTVTITGTDIGGKIVLATGTGSGSGNALCTITFATAFSNAPYVCITPCDTGTGSSMFFNQYSWVTSTTTTFTVNRSAAFTGATTMTFNYHVIGS